MVLVKKKRRRFMQDKIFNIINRILEVIMNKVKNKYMKMKFIDFDDKKKKMVKLSVIKDNINRLEVTIDKIGEDLNTVIQSVSNTEMSKEEMEVQKDEKK